MQHVCWRSGLMSDNSLHARCRVHAPYGVERALAKWVMLSGPVAQEHRSHRSHTALLLDAGLWTSALLSPQTTERGTETVQSRCLGSHDPSICSNSERSISPRGRCT